MKEASYVDPKFLKEVAKQMPVLSNALKLLGVGNAMVAIKSKVAILHVCASSIGTTLYTIDGKLCFRYRS